MPVCGQAVGCGVCDTPALWRGAAGLCARVRAAKSLHIYIGATGGGAPNYRRGPSMTMRQVCARVLAPPNINSKLYTTDGWHPTCWISSHVFLGRSHKNTNTVFRLVNHVYTWKCTSSRLLYSWNRLNLNRIPYFILPPRAYSTCRVDTSRAHEHTRTRSWSESMGVNPGSAPVWPLQDIVLLQSFCVRINHLSITPSYTCIVRTTAILLHVYCAIYDAHPRPPFVCHTPYNIGNGNILWRPSASPRAVSSADARRALAVHAPPRGRRVRPGGRPTARPLGYQSHLSPAGRVVDAGPEIRHGWVSFFNNSYLYAYIYAYIHAYIYIYIYINEYINININITKYINIYL